MTALESHIGREAVLQKLLFIFTSILGLSLLTEVLREGAMDDEGGSCLSKT